MAAEPEPIREQIGQPEVPLPEDTPSLATAEQIAEFFKGKGHDDLKGFDWYNAAQSRGEQRGRAAVEAANKKDQEQRVAEQAEAAQLRNTFEPNGVPLNEQQLGGLIRRNPDSDVSSAYRRYQQIKNGGGADATAIAGRTADEIVKGFTEALAELPEFDGFDFSALEEELTGEADPKARAVKWIRKLWERGTGVTRDEMLAAAREAAKEEALAARNEAQAERKGSSTGPTVIPGGGKPTAGGLNRERYAAMSEPEREEVQKSGALDAAVAGGTF